MKKRRLTSEDYNAMRSDGNGALHGYQTDWAERDSMKEWLKARCQTPHEFDFWWEFYDDLEDCFDDMEPWRIYGEGYIENEERRMRGEEELTEGYVWASGPYIYEEPDGRPRPELASGRR